MNQNGHILTSAERNAPPNAPDFMTENGQNMDIVCILTENGNTVQHTLDKRSMGICVEGPTHVITMGKNTNGVIPIQVTGKSAAL